MIPARLRERNSPDLPPQASGGCPSPAEELTRSPAIPGKPGGSAIHAGTSADGEKSCKREIDGEIPWP
uniref:Uncharacterized protein n=1 Tax=Dulem virus 38 TaxID=3145756 RepID=A0AAU8B2D5_9CAUD